MAFPCAADHTHLMKDPSRNGVVIFFRTDLSAVRGDLFQQGQATYFRSTLVTQLQIYVLDD